MLLVMAQTAQDPQPALQQFLTTFVPRREDQRKSTRTKLTRITDTLNSVCGKYFGWQVTTSQVLAAFESLGYAVFTKKGRWDAAQKRVVPAVDGNLTGGGAVYEEQAAAFVYVAIEPASIKQLLVATKQLPPNTSAAKQAERQGWVSRLETFRHALPVQVATIP